MNERDSFLNYLSVLKRKLQIQYLTKRGIIGLVYATLTILLLLMIGRITPIPYLIDLSFCSASVVLIALFIRGWLTKPDLISAAQQFNQYVDENRVETALEYLDEPGEMIAIQRRDTIERMRRVLPEIHRLKWIDVKRRYPVLLGIAILVIFLSFLFPNGAMEQGLLIEKENNVLQKKKKEIVEKIEEENAIKEKEQEKLIKEVEEAKTGDELLKKLLTKEKDLNSRKQASEKAEQKLRSLTKESSALNGLADALKELDQKKMKQAMDDLKKKDLSNKEQQLVQELSKKINGSKVKDNLSEEERNQLLENLEQSLDQLVADASKLEDLSALQNSIQSSAKSLNSSLQSSGLGGVSSLSFSNSRETTASNSSEAPSDSDSANRSDQNSNPGQSSGSGSGSSGDSNANSGSGNGTGSGLSGGQGGTDAGVGQGSRELTVPNRIDSERKTEKDTGEVGKGSSEMQEAPESPVIPGSVKPYEEVYGEYEAGYRESVDRLQLPTHLEEVVKQYYSELEPEGDNK